MKIEENIPVMDSTPAINCVNKVHAFSKWSVRMAMLVALIDILLIVILWSISDLLPYGYANAGVLGVSIVTFVALAIMYIFSARKINLIVAAYCVETKNCSGRSDTISPIKAGDKFIVITEPPGMKHLPESQRVWKLGFTYTASKVITYKHLSSEIYVGDNWISEECCLPHIKSHT